jgi:hypothetical protein
VQEYSDQQANQARRIVERLLALDHEPPEIEESLVVSDVEADAAEFNAELSLLEELDADAPAVRLGDAQLVPVALTLVMGLAWPFFQTPWNYRDRPSWRRRMHPLLYEWAHIYLLPQLAHGEAMPGFHAIPREQAKATFLAGATDFLATRIAAVQEFKRSQSGRWSSASLLNVLQRASGQRVSTPGCQFTISTNSTGLRVFWSGAYRISPNYFSHPTTPILGVLQSGTYVFGVDGGAYGNQIQWDLNALVTLPGAPHAHLNY